MIKIAQCNNSNASTSLPLSLVIILTSLKDFIKKPKPVSRFGKKEKVEAGVVI